MSNALCAAASSQPATVPASGPANTGESLLLGVTAVGVCVLAVWVVARIINREKFRLLRTPGRPNHLTPGHIVLVVLVWYTLLSLAGAVDKDAHPGMSLLAGTGAQILSLAFCLVVARATFRFGLRRGLGLRMNHFLFDTFRGVLGYLAIFPVCYALHELTIRLLPVGFHQEHFILEALPELSAWWRAVAVFSVVVLAPIGEEVLFRGLIQSSIRRLTASPWTAVAITSVFFAVVHVEYIKDVPAIFALSLAMGYNYERCGRLYPSILMHFLFNGVFVAACLLSSP